ncbi:MAG: hypothetical protein GX493_06690 [Firmicutes bacterium]|nr:hypothetical protein [Bacillota bacterium]
MAEYTLTDLFNPALPHPQGPAGGLSLGEIGLLLLGFQTPNYERMEEFEITGLFLYRF